MVVETGIHHLCLVLLRRRSQEHARRREQLLIGWRTVGSPERVRRDTMYLVNHYSLLLHPLLLSYHPCSRTVQPSSLPGQPFASASP